MVYQEQRLNATFAALSDPTRRAILALLAERQRTIGELAGRFTMTLPAVSKHVRVLERAGLARIRRDGRVRRCRLRPQPMREAAAWIAKYREYWETSLHRLADYLDETSG
jgi:DNA-binding transcriptional ArsR family regulator